MPPVERRFAWKITEGLVLPVEERVLSNGLQVILQPEPGCPVFTLVVAVPAGGRTEGPGEVGVSHFLEHCYSLGSARLGPREFDRMIAGLGGAKNAFTTFDYTAYHARLTVDALPTLLELEAERLSALKLDPDQLAAELEVVKEERRRKDNREGNALAEKVLALAYPDHPYGRTLLGTMEELDALTAETVRRYFERHYVPQNLSLIIAGGIDPERTAALAEQAFGSIPGGVRPEVASDPPRLPSGEQRVVLERGLGDRAHVMALYPGPAHDDPEAIKVELLSVALTGSRIARLPRRLVRERRLATSVSGSFWMLRDPSPLLITASARPGVPLEAVEAALLEEIADVRENGVTDDELAHARAQLVVPALSQYESMAGRALALTASEMLSGDGWQTRMTSADVYWSTPASELKAIAQKYLRLDRAVFGWQAAPGRRTRPLPVPGPSNDPVREEGTGPLVVPGPSASSPPPPRASAHGQDSLRAVLPNGLVTVLQPIPRVPLVAVSAIVRAGSILDPPGRRGLASLLSSVASRGTDELDEEALLRHLARLGTAIGGARNQETIQFRIKLRTSDLAEGLSLLAAVLQRPRFDPQVLERIQQDQVAGRRALASQASTLARLAARRISFPDHPYRWLSRGTPAGLARITAADLHEFHRRHFTPSSTVLGIAGAFDPEALLRLVADAFGAWPRTGVPEAPMIEPSAHPPPRVLLIDKSDQTQAHVTLVQRLFGQRHPHYFALRVFEQILGNMGLVSRIAERVRTREGLAYAIRANIECLSLDGLWSMNAATKASSVAQVMRSMIEETERLLEEGVTAEELGQVRARMRAALAFENESLSHLSTALASAEAWDLGPDYARRYVETITALGSEDVLAAARAHIRPRSFSAVAVGRASEVLSQLETMGPVEVLTPEALDDDEGETR